MQHIIFSNNGLQIFNTLVRKNLTAKDVLFDEKCQGVLQLEYFISKRYSKVDQDCCFHIDLNCSFNEQDHKHIPTFFDGINIYYHLLSVIQRNQQKFQFVFYAFHSKEYIFQKYPILRPDIEANNFFQLPIDKISYQDFKEHKLLPAYAYNLLRGKFQFLKDSSFINPSQGKTVLIIDDEFETIKEAYQSLFECKIVGINKEQILQILAEDYSCIDNIDLKSIDLIISDLYLNESHKDESSNLLNAQDLSGIILQKKLQKYFPRLQEIPLIFLTSSTRIWNFMEFIGFKNFKAWIPKPFLGDILSNAQLFQKSYQLLHISLEKISTK